jgi:hypothetical protein
VPVASIALAGDKHGPSLEHSQLATLDRCAKFAQPIVFQTSRHTQLMFFADP